MILKKKKRDYGFIGEQEHLSDVGTTAVAKDNDITFRRWRLGLGRGDHYTLDGPSDIIFWPRQMSRNYKEASMTPETTTTINKFLTYYILINNDTDSNYFKGGGTFVCEDGSTIPYTISIQSNRYHTVRGKIEIYSTDDIRYFTSKVEFKMVVYAIFENYNITNFLVEESEVDNGISV